jgi:hypothetical protein
MKVYLYILNTMADWETAHITAELNSGRFLKNGKVTIQKVSKPESRNFNGWTEH